MDDKELFEPLIAHLPECRFDGGFCRHQDPDAGLCKTCLESLIRFYKHCLKKINEEGDK